MCAMERPTCLWPSSPRRDGEPSRSRPTGGDVDFVASIGELLSEAYAKARRVHLVLDNLNTQLRKCYDDVLGERAATKLLRLVQIHYTPKHARVG